MDNMEPVAILSTVTVFLLFAFYLYFFQRKVKSRRCRMERIGRGEHKTIKKEELKKWPLKEERYKEVKKEERRNMT